MTNAQLADLLRRAGDEILRNAKKNYSAHLLSVECLKAADKLAEEK